MPRRWPVLRTQPNSRCSASTTGAEQVLRARFFRLKTRATSWAHTDLALSPTRSVWRFHVPPNLDSQYPRKNIFCQEKNAKCGCEFRTVSICSGAFSTQLLPLQHFCSPCLSRYTVPHPISYEAISNTSRSPSLPFFACFRPRCTAILRSGHHSVRLRRETPPPRNSQLWKSHRSPLPRRTAQGNGTFGTEKIGHHHHRRSARRRSRQNRMGTQDHRISRHALCAHPRQRLVSSCRRTARPISLPIPRRSAAKDFRALPFWRRSHRCFRRCLSHGPREMARRTGHQGNVLLRLQRLLAPRDEILHSRFSRAPEVCPRPRSPSHSDSSILLHHLNESAATTLMTWPYEPVFH